MNDANLFVTLETVAAHNWCAVSKLEVSPKQREFVADSNLYLALCAYDPPLWNPLLETSSILTMTSRLNSRR
jgi:hypothetical protein